MSLITGEVLQVVFGSEVSLRIFSLFETLSRLRSRFYYEFTMLLRLRSYDSLFSADSLLSFLLEEIVL